MRKSSKCNNGKINKIQKNTVRCSKASSKWEYKNNEEKEKIEEENDGFYQWKTSPTLHTFSFSNFSLNTLVLWNI